MTRKPVEVLVVTYDRKMKLLLFGYRPSGQKTDWPNSNWSTHKHCEKRLVGQSALGKMTKVIDELMKCLSVKYLLAKCLFSFGQMSLVLWPNVFCISTKCLLSLGQMSFILRPNVWQTNTLKAFQ
jgi:hypothetical protein